jgi:hypothetical protein
MAVPTLPTFYSLWLLLATPLFNYLHVSTILYAAIFAECAHWVSKHRPGLYTRVFEQIRARLGGSGVVDGGVGTTVADGTSEYSVTLIRKYNSATVSVGGAAAAADLGNRTVERVDAVLEYLCNLDAAKHINMDTHSYVRNTEDIELTPQLKARVRGGGGDKGQIEILLYSGTMKLSAIRAWIDDIHEQYCYEKANKLGTRTYYFDEVPMEPMKQMEPTAGAGTAGGTGGGSSSGGAYRWETANKTLQFRMNEFRTSKSFTNVCGGHVAELKERLNLFMNNPDWYAERGIPYSLGILLHGIPGAGKTSTIKAVAKDTGRHIFNLSLRPFTTQKQLTNLFFNETVVVALDDGTKQTYKIPLNKRVYVIEDIDCLTDVVLDRDLRPPEVKNGEAVTLSFLLNLLDGVLETPGRILVITSNYPERLDRALIRPGRIDVRIEFNHASRDFIQEMLHRFYEVRVGLEELPTSLEGVFTPAEVMECFCMHFKNWREGLALLETRAAEKRCGPTILLTDAVMEVAAAPVHVPAPAPAPPNQIVVEQPTVPSDGTATGAPDDSLLPDTPPSQSDFQKMMEEQNAAALAAIKSAPKTNFDRYFTEDLSSSIGIF